MPTFEAFTRTLADLIRVPEPWVRASVFAVGGILLGWLAHRFIMRVWLPIADRTPTKWDELLLRTLGAPVAWTIAFAGLLAAARTLAVDALDDATSRRVLTTGLTVIWGAAVAGLLALAISRAAKARPGSGRGHAAVLLSRFVKVALAVVVLLMLLAVWNVDVTPLVAGAGLVGIAFALAAQDTLANFFAGMAVYFDSLYDVGDYVVLNPGSGNELRGEVRDIGLRSTRILTRDDVLVTVPNSLIANAQVINESGYAPRYRVRVAVSVAYESDLPHVEATLLEVARGHALVLPEPAARMRVRQFADSGINVELLVWIRDPQNRGLVVHDLSMRVHKAFATAGIRIPFPQRDVHIDPRATE